MVGEGLEGTLGLIGLVGLEVGRYGCSGGVFLFIQKIAVSGCGPWGKGGFGGRGVVHGGGRGDRAGSVRASDNDMGWVRGGARGGLIGVSIGMTTSFALLITHENEMLNEGLLTLVFARRWSTT